MARARKSGFGKTILIVSCLGIAGASAVAFYMVGAKEDKPVATASVKSNNVKDENKGVGTLLVPDGQGTCHKYAYGNDSGKAVYEGTAPCDHGKPKESRSSLPPALRAMQDNLKR